MIEVRIHGSGETFAEHAEKNEKGMIKLLELLSNNLELSLEDIRWVIDHPNASASEIADHIKARAEKMDDGEF
jgi:hypothetical protein